VICPAIIFVVDVSQISTFQMILLSLCQNFSISVFDDVGAQLKLVFCSIFEFQLEFQSGA